MLKKEWTGLLPSAVVGADDEVAHQPLEVAGFDFAVLRGVLDSLQPRELLVEGQDFVVSVYLHSGVEGVEVDGGDFGVLHGDYLSFVCCAYIITYGK